MLIGIASIALILISMPFVTDIFRIQKRWPASALVTILSLGIYATLFMALFLEPLLGLVIAFVASAVVWYMIGGRVLDAGGVRAREARVKRKHASRLIVLFIIGLLLMQALEKRDDVECYVNPHADRYQLVYDQGFCH